MIEITALPAFADNYIWLLRANDHVAVIDPGDAAPVLAHLANSGDRLCAILATHHHPDHIGGITEILARHPAPLFAPAINHIAGTTHALSGGERIALPELGLELDVIAVPGHTLGHLAYYGPSLMGDGAVFCGDTLFAAGCGRLFEGTPAQMHASLSRIKALPAETLVYCAHEYTLENLDFALAVEPNNPALQTRLAEVRGLRGQGIPSLPVSLSTEIATNPFLRFDEPSVIVAAAQHAEHPVQPGLEAFTTVRAWRDGY